MPPFALSVSPFNRERVDDNAKNGTGFVEASTRASFLTCHPALLLSFSIMPAGIARRPIFSTRNELFMISFMEDIM